MRSRNPVENVEKSWSENRVFAIRFSWENSMFGSRKLEGYTYIKLEKTLKTF